MAINYRRLARQKAKKYGINPDYFERQIGAESGFNPRAGSPKGARGIAQIMPGTARGWGVNPNDPVASLDAAAKNMSRYLRAYGGDWRKALAAYNAGPGAVQKYGGVPPFAETKNYIAKIIGGGNAKNVGARAGGATLTGVKEVRAPRLQPGKTETDYSSALVDTMLTRRGKGGSLLKSAMARAERDPAYQIKTPAKAIPGKTKSYKVNVDGEPASPTGVKAGGGWSGSANIVRGLGSGLGLGVSSAKRARKNTATGGVSDHFEGNKGAFAWDLSGDKAKMDRAFAQLRRKTGKPLKYNAYNNFNVKSGGATYRVQVIYGPDVKHGDHIHIGVSRVG